MAVWNMDGVTEMTYSFYNDRNMKKHVEEWNKMVQINGLPDFWMIKINMALNKYVEAMAKSSEKDKSISEDMETIKNILKKYTK